MNAAGRLGLYAAGLVVAFGAAYGVSSAVVPAGAAAAWQDSAGMDGHTEAGQAPAEAALPGLSLSSGGYLLSPVTASGSVGEAGTLSFRVLDSDGSPVTGFETSHEKDLHLIVVRSDGSEFTHAHPGLDLSTGTWSTPWQWKAAGTYRVYADFVPAGDNTERMTLSRTIEVAGTVTPARAMQTRTTDEVDGFVVSLDGQLTAGQSQELAITVSRDGAPVTTLQPYLGAFGHLVVLRDGDLAYLHVHAEGQDPEAGQTAGPTISFAAEAPTAGRYLLYLDFQVDGQVHTAEFVLDATTGEPAGGHDDPMTPKR